MIASPIRSFVAALERRRAWASVLQLTKLIAWIPRLDHPIDSVAAATPDTDDAECASSGVRARAGPAAGTAGSDANGWPDGEPDHDNNDHGLARRWSLLGVCPGIQRLRGRRPTAVLPGRASSCRPPGSRCLGWCPEAPGQDGSPGPAGRSGTQSSGEGRYGP